jgi:hypothetical protein
VSSSVSLAGDYNNDGIVSHADYATLSLGISQGGFSSADFDIYLANYGRTASEPSALPFAITSSATIDGNVQWTFTFSNVSGPLAGHLSLRVDGPNAPNILSMVAGPSFMDNGAAPVGLPGIQTFPWLTLIDVDPGSGTNNRPLGVQFNNSTHEAYAALGLDLGQTFTNANLTFLTLVTEGQQTTTLRVLGGIDISEYGYAVSQLASDDYFFTTDQVATFTAIPESSCIVVWSCLGLGVIARTVWIRWRRI